MTETYGGHEGRPDYLRALDGGRASIEDAENSVIPMPVADATPKEDDDGIRVNKAAIERRLTLLIQEHRDLDDSIRALETGAHFDQLQIKRLKKRKLSLKDEIAKARSLLVPDIIA